jgi:chromosome segregation ATPase
MEPDELDLLEAQIDRLLSQHAQVKRQKEHAETRLQQREGEFHQLKGQLRQYERERGELRSRLNKILGQLERLDLG